LEDREDRQSGTQAELPKYKCHKIVHAAKITEIKSHESDGTGSHTMIFGEVNMSKFLTDEWKNKHNPKAGGYYVVYEDGYTSYSPAEAFESGYSKI
jgi:hypothetical protein